MKRRVAITVALVVSLFVAAVAGAVLHNEPVIIRQQDDPLGSGLYSQSPVLSVQNADGDNYFVVKGLYGDAFVSGGFRAGIRGIGIGGATESAATLVTWTRGDSAPTTDCANGSLHSRTDIGKLYVCEGGSWVGK